MKVLIVLSAIVASCLVDPSFGQQDGSYNQNWNQPQQDPSEPLMQQWNQGAGQPNWNLQAQQGNPQQRDIYGGMEDDGSYKPELYEQGQRRKRQLFSQNIGGWGIPAVLANGHIADTPEVAAAKAAHFAEVARQSGGHYMYKRAAPEPLGRRKRDLSSQNTQKSAVQNGPARPSAPSHAPVAYAQAKSSNADRQKRQLYSQNYYGWGIPQVLPNGYLADTPEVAAAKAAHFAEHARRSGHYIYKRSVSEAGGRRKRQLYTQNFYGYAIPQVLPNGYLADTPEVAAAKAAHFAEHARQASWSMY